MVESLRRLFRNRQSIFILAFIFGISCFYAAENKAEAKKKKFTLTVKVNGTKSKRKGVLIEIEGKKSASKKTSISGTAKFKGLPKGSYVVTPSKEGVSFTPETKEINLNKNRKAKFKAAKANVEVNISPSSNINIPIGGQITFAANVSGTSNTDVTWESSGIGELDANGVFTATVEGAAVITATSVADPAKSASVSLNVVSLENTAFSGSTSCQGCHSTTYSSWSGTAHAKAHLSPSSTTIVSNDDFAAGDPITTSDGKVKFKPLIDGSNYKVVLYDVPVTGTTAITYTVARTHGGVASEGKQRYQVKIGNSHYVLPIQYNSLSSAINKWVDYNSTSNGWYNSDKTLKVTDNATAPNLNKSFEQNCEGCHATGLDITKNESDEFVSNSTELGIACERCHGPGEDHIAAGGGANNKIVSPDKATYQVKDDTCRQCHVRIVSADGGSAEFETEYSSIVTGSTILPFIMGSGFVLADFMVDEGGYWGDNNSVTYGTDASENNHSKQHHQQSVDYSKSEHFEEMLSCFDCHDPHGSSEDADLAESALDNTLCVSCHTEYSTETALTTHTQHTNDPETTGASRCIGCHMPKTAKSATSNDIASHVFDIIKPATTKAMADSVTGSGGTPAVGSNVVNNSCYDCHADSDYGVAKWDEKFGS